MKEEMKIETKIEKTCKDCIHEKVCKIRHFPSMFGLTGEDCGHFKDKSRYIELPCAVGDNVYFIDTCRTAEDYGKKYVSWGEVLQLTFNRFGNWVVLTDKSLLRMYDEAFLTKEDAEQVLKGGEQK